MQTFRVNTRLGRVSLKGSPIEGTPIVVSSEDHVIKQGKRILQIPQGAVLIPRRYGPKKDGKKSCVVMQVYPDVFAALRSRYSLTAYYGRPGRGQLFGVQKVIEGLRRDAKACPDSLGEARLNILADRFTEDMYSTGRMFSRMDIWTNALMLAFENEEKALRELRKNLDAFRFNQTVDPLRLRYLAAELRLNPFVDLSVRVNVFAGDGCERFGILNSSEERRISADDMIDEIDVYLPRIEFEKAHFLAKELERAVVDDVDRARTTDDGRLYSRMGTTILQALNDLVRTLPKKRDREALAVIRDELVLVERGFDHKGLDRDTVASFVALRSKMKEFGARLI